MISKNLWLANLESLYQNMEKEKLIKITQKGKIVTP